MTSAENKTATIGEKAKTGAAAEILRLVIIFVSAKAFENHKNAERLLLARERRVAFRHKFVFVILQCF